MIHINYSDFWGHLLRWEESLRLNISHHIFHTQALPFDFCGDIVAIWQLDKFSRDVKA